MPDGSPDDVYAVFAAPIDPNAVSRIFAGATAAIGAKRTKIQALIALIVDTAHFL